jgi:hypothetical protein
MRSITISFLLALIAIFSFNAAVAQKANPKISNPDQGDVRISANEIAGGYRICIDYVRITGLGNATSVAASLTVVATADVTCLSPGQVGRDDPNPSPGQSVGGTGETQYLQASNGVLIIQGCSVYVDILGSCKNKNQTVSGITNVNVTDLYLTLNGKRVSLNDYLDQLEFN